MPALRQAARAGPPPGIDASPATDWLLLARELCYLGRFEEAEPLLTAGTGRGSGPVARALVAAVEALLPRRARRARTSWRRPPSMASRPRRPRPTARGARAGATRTWPPSPTRGPDRGRAGRSSARSRSGNESAACLMRAGSMRRSPRSCRRGLDATVCPGLVDSYNPPSVDDVRVSLASARPSAVTPVSGALGAAGGVMALPTEAQRQPT